MAKRFPLVVDTENNNRIIELPIDDCLDLTGTDICSVENITVTGTLTLPTGPVTSFTGNWLDIIDKPFIPTDLIDLGIQDGISGQFLKARGDGTFEFATVSVLYENITNPPVLPESILDLDVTDGSAGQYLTTDGNGNFTFTEITDINLGNLSINANTISNTQVNQPIILEPNGLGAVTINSTTSLVIPVGGSATRLPLSQGAIRFNIDLNQFEGYNGTGWSSLGGVRSLDSETYILAETSPGLGDDKLLFYTDNTLRLEITNTEVNFDENLTVNINNLVVDNLTLDQELSLAGDITIGDSPDDTFTLYSKIDGEIVPKKHDTYNLGSDDLRWRNLYTSGRVFVNDYELPLTGGEANSFLKAKNDGSTEFVAPDIWGGNRVYVSEEYGNDDNDGITAPVKTIKRGVQIAGGMVFEPLVKDETVEHETSLLRAAKTQIADDTIKYIATTYPNFGYDTIKCRRDMQYIIDAVIIDHVLGTNYNQVTAAHAYFRPNAAYTLGNQNTDTIVALNQLTAEISDLDIWSVSKNEIETAINISRDAIAANTSAGIPPILLPSPSVLPTPQAIEAQDRLNLNKSFIQEEVNAWIGVNYPSLVYDDVKCKRDIGYIVDALRHDVLYGGNFASVTNAKAYFIGTQNQLAAGQETATAAAYTYMITVVKQIIEGIDVTRSTGNILTQDKTGNDATVTESLRLAEFIAIIIKVIEDNTLDSIARTVMPNFSWTDIRRKAAFTAVKKNESVIKTNVITQVNTSGNYYDSIKCHRDVEEIIDSIIYDLRYGGNSRTVAAGESYYDGNNNLYITGQVTETQAAITYARTQAVAYLTGTRATALEANMDLINDIITDKNNAPAKVYGQFKTKQVTVRVSTGDYIEDNPIILPDNVSLIGDNLRRSIIRPKNANRDLFRVRNSVYMTGLVFRDHLDANNVPDFTFRYGISFDNVADTATSRAGYINLPVSKPVIFTSPYIQNVSVISFLGGGGTEIDGNLVEVPNIPPNAIEAENPVDLADGIPEQGKSMVANAYTILSFGGNAWRVINDAYAQIVSCFVIFCENGCLTQNGGYLSITNSASNFGLFSLRSTGYSPNSFQYDRGYIFKQLEIEGFQTFGVLGLKRAPLEHYVLRLKDNIGTNDITDNYLFNHNQNLEKTVSIIPDINNVSGNQITFSSPHNFLNGEYVEYDANGDAEIVGLLNEVKYYVSVPNPNAIILYHDADFGKPVRTLDASVCTGTHYFKSGFEYIYIEEVLETHNTYQDWLLPQTENGNFVNYGIVVGNFFTATNTSGKIVNAAVAAWDFDSRKLTVSIEYTTEGNTQVRNLGDAGTTIQVGPIHTTPLSNITVLSVSPRTDLFSSDFKILTTENSAIEFIANTVTKQVYFHRPSICNSSAHTWEFAGSGVDYNALPQNGGLTDEYFEQVSTIPGRVYSSGTNEIGDFKVGNFVRAYNRTGNIDFKNKVNIGELDSLSLSLSSGIVVSAISGDIELGDNEIGGPSNSRLITQLAIRSFLENRLGDFIDKQVSSNAIPSSIVQLNSSGLINSDLIPPTGNFTAYIVESYKGRLELHETIPVTDLNAGDIVIEEYDEITLTLNDTVTVTEGETITQATNFGAGTVLATGVVKQDYTTATEIKLIEPFTGTFTTNVTQNTLEGSVSGPLVDGNTDGIYPLVVAGPSEVRENYFITTSRAKQYLLTDPSQTYSFTQGSIVQGAVSGAIGTIDEFVEGVLIGLDIINDLPNGTGYTPGTYVDVQMLYHPNSPGSKLGAFALADVVVNANGEIASIDLKRGGYGYAETETLTVPETVNEVTLPNATFVPRSTAGIDLEISISNTENRLYITLDQSAGLEFNANNTNLDFIIDDTVVSVSTTVDALPLSTAFLGDVTGVDQANDYIIFAAAHPYVNGDHVKYDVNNNPQVIGGLTNQDTYYVKVIDAITIQLYTDYGLQGQNLVNITSAPGGQASHIFYTHNLSVDVDRFYIPAHGLQTGDAVKVTAADPPSGMVDGEFLFVGSVTANTFSLHDARGSALSSTNGLVVAALNYLTQGTGTVSLRKQTVIISGDANTSGQLETSWSNLTTTTIDADNIISGIINPARLGTGTANTDTFLRGDNSWQYAVAGLKNTTLNDPITLIGNFYNDGINDIYYGDIDIKVEKAGYLNPANPVANEETVGVAAFAYDFFTITGDGVVSTKSTIDGGEIDAKYLAQYPSTHYLNPVNLSRDVPIENGGTNRSSYTAGDIIYAATDLPVGNAFSSSLSTLPIGTTNDVMIVDQNLLPAWTSNLTLNGATIDDIQIGITNSNEIDTVTFDLILDSATGETLIDDNLTVSGNLTVQGTTTTLNTTTLEVEDINITVAKGAVDVTAADGAGLTVDVGTNNPVITSPAITYTSIDDYWNINKTLNAGTNTFISTATIGFVGNATSADAWSTARTVTFEDNGATVTGVTGSFTIDGSANISNVVLTLVNEQVQDIVGAMVVDNSESGINVSYDDANGKIDFNVADPSITIAGSVAGSQIMNNLGDVTITVSQQNDSVTLGTHTTGNYVATVSIGEVDSTAGLTLTGAAGEGTAVTLSHADTSSQASTSNGTGTVISNITLDTYGHITGISSVSVALTLDEILTNGNTTARALETGTHTIIGDVIIKDTATAVDGVIGSLLYVAEDNNSNEEIYANIDAVIKNKGDGTEVGRLEFKVINAGTSTLSFYATPTSLEPGADDARDLGATGNEWSQIFVTTVTSATTNATTIGTQDITVSGTATFNGAVDIGDTATDTLTITSKIDSNLVPYAAQPSTTATTSYNLGASNYMWNTVYAGTFSGTATKALYADLAEMYLPDKHYAPGTVMQFGGTAEVCAANEYATTKIAGVVSTNPAYLMNAELENGCAIALKGRVPCLVLGKVEKGDMLIASDIHGVATVTKEFIGGAIIGKAVESSDDEDVKVIEIAVGVL